MESKVFVLIVSLTAVQSAIITGPTNYLKKLNDSVELTCVTDGGGCSKVDWQKVEGPQAPKPVYRDDRGLLNPLYFDQQRYSFSASNGCSLIINRLMIKDSGRFICLHTKDGAQDSKGAILVVVSVTKPCLSNLTNNELVKGEGYIHDCAIEIPPKSLEPSNVTLALWKNTERLTSAVGWETTVRTTLASTATSENVTRRTCKASFPPVSQLTFDQTVATLDVCSTEPLTVLYPVEDVVFSPLPPYYKGSVVHCSASGYPIPTFIWTPLESEDVVSGGDLTIGGGVGKVYECTATNSVSGKVYSANKTIEVSATPACGSGCIAIIVVLTIVGFLCIVVILFPCWKYSVCPLYGPLHSFMEKDGKNRSDAGQPLTKLRESSGARNLPAKPPRASDGSPQNF